MIDHLFVGRARKTFGPKTILRNHFKIVIWYLPCYARVVSKLKFNYFHFLVNFGLVLSCCYVSNLLLENLSGILLLQRSKMALFKVIGARYEGKKFRGHKNFTLWRVQMEDILYRKDWMSH